MLNLKEQFEIDPKNQNNVISVDTDLEDNLLNIKTDETRLNQIISNLIENAIKFTKNGKIEINYTLEKDNLLFSIKDNGIGISSSDKEIIFDRFSQGENNITEAGSENGLGLSIVKNLVDLFKGKVWVESELGEGATFFFTIPYLPADLDILENNIKTKPNDSIPNEFSILIVDDEYSNYLYLEMLLKYKFKLYYARDGQSAIDIFQKNSGIDLILMDLKMPIMNSYDAAREINHLNKEIPIIACTAYAMSSDKEKALKAGFKDYIAKPIVEKDLVNLIQKHLNETVK